MKTIFPLLDGPVKSVRIEAARVLARIPDGQLQHDQLASYERAVGKYNDPGVICGESSVDSIFPELARISHQAAWNTYNYWLFGEK